VIFSVCITLVARFFYFSGCSGARRWGICKGLIARGFSGFQYSGRRNFEKFPTAPGLTTLAAPESASKRLAVQGFLRFQWFVRRDFSIGREWEAGPDT
jgi:hypothetical protein